MYFVAKQHQEFGRTFDVNVRMGGFKTKTGAWNAARKHGMCLVKDEHRHVVGQTITPDAPNYIASVH